jgi:hypothetical protein
METRSPSLEPAILIVDSNPDAVLYLDEIVTIVLGVHATTFTDAQLAIAWCVEHPVHPDLVISGEGDQDFNGFLLLKKLDELFLRPVYAVLLLNPRENDYSAETWFYQLDKVFAAIQPFKAIRFPYLMHELGTALDRAFPWYAPAARSGQKAGKSETRGDGE